jgi:hypothetical protein
MPDPDIGDLLYQLSHIDVWTTFPMNLSRRIGIPNLGKSILWGVFHDRDCFMRYGLIR